MIIGYKFGKIYNIMNYIALVIYVFLICRQYTENSTIESKINTI